jgi:hypothetical protein
VKSRSLCFYFTDNQWVDEHVRSPFRPEHTLRVTVPEAFCDLVRVHPVCPDVEGERQLLYWYVNFHLLYSFGLQDPGTSKLATKRTPCHWDCRLHMRKCLLLRSRRRGRLGMGRLDTPELPAETEGQRETRLLLWCTKLG